MILLDANLLIYAVNEDMPLHGKARPWLESVLNGTETVGFSWIVLLAFLRLTTRAGLFTNPLTAEQAFSVVENWLAQPASMIVDPGPRHLRQMRSLLGPLGTAGNLTSDAHLAALAMEIGAEVCSCDHDFGRFVGVKWRNPLA